MLHTLLFLGVYAAGFFFTIAANPAFSFVLYEVVYFFNPLGRWWGYNVPSISYSFLTVILMFFAYLIKAQTKKTSNKLLSAPQFKWVYALGLLYAVTWFHSVYPADHKVAAINYIKLMIIISIAYKLIDTNKNLNFALWGYIFGSWYIGFLTWQSGRNSGNRVEGIGTVDAPDSNGIAAALVPSLVICLYYIWIKKNIFYKFIFAFAGVFIANALVLINSRASFLAAGSSIGYFMYHMYFSSYQRKYQKAAAIGMTLLGIAGLIYLIDDVFIARLQTMQNTEITLEQESGTTRFVFWVSALEMAQDYPFGNGVRGFDYYATYYIPEGMDSGASRVRSVHSTWMEALTEIGYLGLLLFFLMLYASYKALNTCIVKLKEQDDVDNYFKVIMLKSAFFAYIIAMSFMNRLRAELLYWIILYSACAYNIYVLKSSDNDKSAIENKT